jgi:hypothetical protein
MVHSLLLLIGTHGKKSEWQHKQQSNQLKLQPNLNKNQYYILYLTIAEFKIHKRFISPNLVSASTGFCKNTGSWEKQ